MIVVMPARLTAANLTERLRRITINRPQRPISITRKKGLLTAEITGLFQGVTGDIITAGTIEGIIIVAEGS